MKLFGANILCCNLGVRQKDLEATCCVNPTGVKFQNFRHNFKNLLNIITGDICWHFVLARKLPIFRIFSVHLEYCELYIYIYIV
jgi:hypothetical protein